MSQVTQSVEELMAKTPQTDNEAVFQKLWGIMSELRHKMDSALQLQLDPSTADLNSYDSLEGGAKGHLQGLYGDKVDWMIHSFFGNPTQGFTNMHLTTWLGAQLKVPHWGMALGTIPDVFVYLDYIPRVDLSCDLDYLDQYYQDQNEIYMDFEGDDAFRPFVSRTVYMRQAQSPTSLCYVCKPTADNLDKIQKTAHTMLDRWLAWIEVASAVPSDEQGELSARDLHLRRSISQRDPANVMGEKILGKDLTDRLVGTLWGENRQSQRVGAWQQ